MARMALSSKSFWKWLSILLSVALVSQWIMFSFVLSHRQDPNGTSSATAVNTQDNTVHEQSSPHHVQQQQSSRRAQEGLGGAVEWKGVGATLMFFAPKWFHRRYTFMVQNAMANLPSDWAIQLVINAPWMEKDVFPLHPGLQTLLRTTTYSNATPYNYDPRPGARLLWTPLPVEFTSKSRREVKPKTIMKSAIFWESLISENVFLFSGNGAFCGNGGDTSGAGTGELWESLTEYDFVGTPWNQYHGNGGSGETHSFRHKSTMLSILKAHPPEEESSDVPDYNYFAKYLLSSGSDGSYKVADVPTTELLGGISQDKAPLVVSGTQAGLSFDERENLLFVCPELKVIFPSLQ